MIRTTMIIITTAFVFSTTNHHHGNDTKNNNHKNHTEIHPNIDHLSALSCSNAICGICLVGAGDFGDRIATPPT